ncbi:MAG: metal-dependent transcriptional regulator [Chloroflexi bacterium]|nr:metal-dependent transcriptional regulator [Chloroflexota bacterium]
MAEKTVITPRVEEYLESMLNMELEGKKVLAARLAERLGLTPPTIAATLRRMKRDGLIVIGPQKAIGFTDKGRKLALTVVRRHRLAERLLADVLKVPWHEVHDEACLMEHGISATVEEKLYDTLGHPAACPHGNPIPQDDSIQPLTGVPLDTVPEGTKIVVQRLSEESVRHHDFLQFLETNGIVPGAFFVVKEVAIHAGTLTLARGDRLVSLGTATAGVIWVSPVRE